MTEKKKTASNPQKLAVKNLGEGGKLSVAKSGKGALESIKAGASIADEPTTRGAAATQMERDRSADMGKAKTDQLGGQSVATVSGDFMTQR